MSRNVFICFRCRTKIATIRANPDESRVLKPVNGAGVSVVDDHRILLDCPGCGTVNQYTWRARPEPEAVTDTLPIKTATVATTAGP